MLQFLLTQIGKLKAAYSSLNSKIASQDMKPSQLLTSSNDMNSVDVGTYYQSGASMPSNPPNSTANNALIMVFSARSSDRIQFWISINSGSIYWRKTNEWSNGSSSNWTNWATINTIS